MKLYMLTTKALTMHSTYCVKLRSTINALLLFRIRAILADKRRMRAGFGMQQGTPLLHWTAISKTHQNFSPNWLNDGSKETRWFMAFARNAKKEMQFVDFFIKIFIVFFENFPILCHSMQVTLRL